MYAELGAFRRGEIPQNVLRGVQVRRWAADPEPDAQVIGAAQRSGDRPETVVTGVPSAAFDPQHAEGQVELIVDDDQTLPWNAEVVQQTGDRAAGLVHVRKRLGEHRWLTGQPAIG